MKRIRSLRLLLAVVLAVSFFCAVPSYAAVGNPVTSGGVTTWNCIWFGNWLQNSASPEKIKWRVLNVSGGKALIISDTILDAAKFHNGSTVVYEKAAISGYLSDMEKKMFTSKERAALIAGDQDSRVTVPGILALPSEAMMMNTKYGFTSNKNDSVVRRAASTSYVSDTLGYKDLFYWLSDTESFRASAVNEKGMIKSNYYDNSNKLGIRPIAVLDISKDVWSDAGTINSEGVVKGPKPKANPLSVQGKTTAVRFKKLKKKNQTLAVDKVITFKNKGQGTRTYKLVSAKKGKKSFKKKFSVNKTTGKVTVKKGLKKGKYKVRINVTASGNSNYQKATKQVTVTIRVK